MLVAGPGREPHGSIGRRHVRLGEALRGSAIPGAAHEFRLHIYRESVRGKQVIMMMMMMTMIIIMMMLHVLLLHAHLGLLELLHPRANHLHLVQLSADY